MVWRQRLCSGSSFRRNRRTRGDEDRFPEILHKSDVGGIRLNLADRNAVLAEYDQLMKDIHAAKPDARLDGVLIEKMAPRGQEVIIGMKRDAGFGPLLMFGLGGIYVELFKDVAFRIAPVSSVEAHQMIAETRAGTAHRIPRLCQDRLDAVVDVIQRLGCISLDFPQMRKSK